jgi:hypothetical protein
VIPAVAATSAVVVALISAVVVAAATSVVVAAVISAAAVGAISVVAAGTPVNYNLRFPGSYQSSRLGEDEVGTSRQDPL